MPKIKYIRDMFLIILYAKFKYNLILHINFLLLQVEMSNLNRSRYGRVSTKRKFNEELMGESSRTIKDPLPTKNSNLSLSVSNNNLNMRSNRTNELTIGDMVWAKTGKYPLWPGIIISDPESNNFSKSKYA